MLWSLVEEAKGTSHRIPFQQDDIGLRGEWKHLTFYTFPGCAFLWVLNTQEQPVFLFLHRPFPLSDGDTVRFGEIPFVFHYAGTPVVQVEEGADLRTVYGPAERPVREIFLLDCMECLHPNFRGKILNLEEDDVEIDRGSLAVVLGVRRESLLAQVGVSSSSTRMYRDSHGIWWVVPPSKPTVSLQAPRYFFQLLPGDRIEVEGQWYRIHKNREKGS